MQMKTLIFILKNFRFLKYFGRYILICSEICKKKGDEKMEQITDVKWVCSGCSKEITDETEYLDNDGLCDDCYSIPIKKRIGKVR
jgi:hypothetical protein